MKKGFYTSEQIQYWSEIAEYDLKSAKVLLKSKRYLHVGFMCHQALEKLLKAYFVKSKNKTPPYTHNLNFLLKETNLLDILSDEQALFVDSMTPLNIECRYPSYKKQLAKTLTSKRCKIILDKTEEFFEWVKKKL